MQQDGPGTGPFSARQAPGFTLVEVLIVLGILGVLLGIATPAFSSAIASNRARSAMLELRSMLGLARQSAITMRRDITLCGTSDGRTCAQPWRSQPTLIFVDANDNRRADSGEHILLVADLTRNGEIRWRASGGRNFLRYRRDGGVSEYGNFTYCPHDGNAHHARQIVISATGRPRSSRDVNGDGIVDDRNGNSLVCD